jgi:iron-sulfur cluster repair protein YtfE (RIC family)
MNSSTITRPRLKQQRATATEEGERSQLLGQLRGLALRLDAILELHLAKEERIYLPLIEEHVDEERQSNVLRAIHASYEK